MKKYLYGASVQGIQQFIFDTNKLREIIGASELVEEVCTTMFDKFSTEGVSVVRAAGNIKHIFGDKDVCARAVLEFPHDVIKKAPGITISQAVVGYDDGEENAFKNAVKELEAKLIEARNRPLPPVETGLCGIERSRNTGRPVVEITRGEHIDSATRLKRLASDGTAMKLSHKAFIEKELSHGELSYDIEDMTSINSWIAIVHADGNGLGRIVQLIGSEPDLLKAFSRQLDIATCKAAQCAYEEIVCKERLKHDHIPLRPIVLSGDDYTFIIRGDLAVPYTSRFLASFEEETKNRFNKEIVSRMQDRLNKDQKKILMKGLTACAGITFVKSSYPFHYGYRLAEELCSEAKKHAKEINADLAPSCLMFHKVQDSFVESYDKIMERELNPREGISYQYGPYYVKEQKGKLTVEKLLWYAELLGKGNMDTVRTGLRKWMSTLAISGIDAALQYGERIRELHTGLRSEEQDLLNILPILKDGRLRDGQTPVYDIYSLTSISNLITK